MKTLIEDNILEILLVQSKEQKNIKVIKSRTCKKLVAQGDNYISNVWKEVVTVKYRDGTVGEVSVIMKSLPEGEYAQAFIEQGGFFLKEIMMYTQVLPSMENLMKSIDNCDRLWPRCLGCRTNDLLILEDLTQKGFKTVNRHKGLDLDHSLLAFKAIAKFHTLSLVVKDKLRLTSKDFVRYEKNNTSQIAKFKLVLVTKIKTLAKVMLNKWEPKWYKLALHLENNCVQIINRFIEVFQSNQSEFKVLNHGDPWTSNLLFKYSEFTGNLVGIRLVDFQMRHYGSFALDLQYLLNTSVQDKVMKYHLGELLTAYHDTVCTLAKRLALSKMLVPSLECLQAEMHSKQLFGIIMAIHLGDMMLVESSVANNLNTIVKNNWVIVEQLSEEYQDRIKFILEPFIDGNVADLYC